MLRADRASRRTVARARSAENLRIERRAIGIVPAGADCCLQVHASVWDVFALCVEPDRYSAFALNAGLPTADINEDLIDKDATMHHLCRALASSSDQPGSSGTFLWQAISP